MIDAMQRLNIDYHFQEEIDAFLRRQFVISSTSWDGDDNDLHHTALCFRLFRQQGQYVPEGGFVFFFLYIYIYFENFNHNLKLSNSEKLKGWFIH